MEIKARLNNLRIGPRKIRLVAELVKGMGVQEAIGQLRNLNKKSSPYLIKLIESAIANAENNFNLHRDNLFIKYITVDQDVTIKRWQPRAFGRATNIRKRGSKINVVLADKESARENGTKKDDKNLKKEKVIKNKKEPKKELKK